MIKIQKLNVIKEIDKRDLKYFEEKGYKVIEDIDKPLHNISNDEELKLKKTNK